MNNIYKISLLLILFSAVTHSQILNGGFEQWSDGEPVSWLSNNIDEDEVVLTPVTQSSFAHSGNSSLKGEVVAIEEQGVTITFAPMVDAGEFENLGFPFSGRPKRIRGYYNLNLVGGDEFVNNCFIMNGDDILAVGGITKFTSTGPGWHELIMEMNYIDTVTTPNKIMLHFTIKPPGLQTAAHVGSYFYVDDFPSMSLIYPPEQPSEKLNDPIVFIAGEKDSIKWDAGGAVNVKLEYSDDDGMTYQSIENSYPADSGKYTWEVPANLITRKAKIKLTEVGNTSNKAESELFTIKPWQLTRIDASDELELFEVGQHTWTFGNSISTVWPQSWWQRFDYSGTDPFTGEDYPLWFPFINADPQDFPDWELFVNVFGVENCYVFGNSYRSEATTHWGGIFDGIRRDWGGSCFGFAVTSLLAFYHTSALASRFPGIAFTNLSSASLNNASRYVVNYFFLHQYGAEARATKAARLNSYSPRELLQDLKDIFSKENGDSRQIAYYNNNGPGGHAVTPYKMERVNSSSIFNVLVYNSLTPSSDSQIIQIDSSLNVWTDITNLNWGQGNFGCFLRRESVDFFETPTIPGSESKKKGSLNFPSLAENYIFYNSSYADITITGSGGDQIGFQDSAVFNNIEGAFPIIPETSSYQPPIGYDLPLDDYTVQMSNFEDSSSYAFFMSEGTIYNYRRPNAAINEIDILEYSDSGVRASNPDGSLKTANFETIVLEDSTNEKIFVTNNVSLSAGDSIIIKEENREHFVMQNYGSAMNYELQIRNVSENGIALFSNQSIALSENSTHKVVPDWNDLANNPVKIYIDDGNDGSIDDSMTVSNQLTDVRGSRQNLNPDEFYLAQNYPNPFNPNTTIKYVIPSVKTGHAPSLLTKLTVFDILGNEIRTLVNESKQPGIYEVELNAANLPSGVYFYRLQAGKFSETLKMILLK